MTALARHQLSEPIEAPAPQTAIDGPLLNRLRFLSIECRAAARIDPFRACELVDAPSQDMLDLHARALVKVLGQSIAGTFRFNPPGSADTSFDEAWLLRLLDRTRAGDLSSLAFLLHRRVARPYHAVVRTLLLGLG